MAEMNKVPELTMPTARPAVRENGDAVVEVVHDGQLVGELNFTKIFTNWARRLGWLPSPKPELKSVP